MSKLLAVAVLVSCISGCTVHDTQLVRNRGSIKETHSCSVMGAGISGIVIAEIEYSKCMDAAKKAGFIQQ